MQSGSEPDATATISAKTRATVTPTGCPHFTIGVSLVPSLDRKPVRKSSIGPGFPLFIGKKITL